MKILMVLTSHDQLGDTGRKTGFWLEEFAAPYFVFMGAGVDLTLASPKGGQPPLDPKSDLPENQTPAMARFKKDAAAQKALANTAKLADMKAEDFDTVFYPGGHGPMWDLAESPTSIALLEAFYSSGKPIALVCHSPGVLRHVTYLGAPLVKGKHVAGFTNGEEDAMQLTNSRLRARVARFNSAPGLRRPRPARHWACIWPSPISKRRAAKSPIEVSTSAKCFTPERRERSSRSMAVGASAGQHRIMRATAPSRRSKIRTATSGSYRRSVRDCRAVSIPARLRSLR